LTDIPNEEVVPQIISEIVELEADCVAIAAVMVMKDGTIRTRRAFMDGQKLPLLAGVTLQHNDFCRAVSDDPRNYALEKAR
jgi:hypothetical protein